MAFMYFNFLITSTFDAFILFIFTLFGYIVRKIGYICLYNFLTFSNASSIFKFKDMLICWDELICWIILIIAIIPT